GELQTRVAQSRRDLVPVAALLDMRRIDPGHRTVQPVLRPVLVDPVPDVLGGVVETGDVEGAAVTIAAGAAGAAVQRVADLGLEAGSEALAIIVAERAEDRPFDAVGVHRLAGMIELLAEFRVHAADHVIRQRHAYALGRRRILPGEVAGAVAL